jgi:hypothetical protein
LILNLSKSIITVAMTSGIPELHAQAGAAPSLAPGEQEAEGPVSVKEILAGLAGVFPMDEAVIEGNGRNSPSEKTKPFMLTY